ncbi:hypothetical protein EVAR_103834_1 [Eumeta japonica]|uniref:Uncharacterized protein n=1 Tax=Eumeta variegata TaxID=151549 RepID=A0A4C2A8Y4_EUMVA|nr:hypothetical protein EVAR_103834_1 [Eumeta japonica]
MVRRALDFDLGIQDLVVTRFPVLASFIGNGNSKRSRNTRTGMRLPNFSETGHEKNPELGTSVLLEGALRTVPEIPGLSIVFLSYSPGKSSPLTEVRFFEPRPKTVSHSDERDTALDSSSAPASADDFSVRSSRFHCYRRGGRPVTEPPRTVPRRRSMRFGIPAAEAVARRATTHGSGAVIGPMARVSTLPTYDIFRPAVCLRVPILLAFSAASYVYEVAHRDGFPSNIILYPG